MDIRIKTLKLENFKGTREAAYEFNGKNVRVDGDNGTGKSTIFDAFTWLMFGKDHNGNDQTKFDIKTIDPETRRPIERVDHSVEAVLLVDGIEQTLKRVWRESWVKPKGEVDAVMKGHSTLFFVNGVDVATKKAYDDIIHQWISEDVFKLITDPLFFIGDRTHWKARREVLMNLVAGKVDTESVKAQYAELLKEMNGENMDNFRKRISAQRKENMRLLQEKENKVAAYKETLPEEQNKAQIEAEKEWLKAEREKELAVPYARIREIDERMADVTKEKQGMADEVSRIFGRISELQMEQGRMMEEGLKDAQEKNAARSKSIMEARQSLNEAKMKVEEHARRLEGMKRTLHDYQLDKAELSADLKRLGDQYNEEKAKTFNFEPTTRCHACGQELPAETIEEALKAAKRAYEEDQKKAVGDIVEKAKRIKEDIAKVSKSIDNKEKEIETLKGEMEKMQSVLEGMTEGVEMVMAVPEIDLQQMKVMIQRGDAYAGKEKEIRELKETAMGLKPDDDSRMQDLQREKSSEYDSIKVISDKYTNMMKELDSKLVTLAIRDNTLKLIEKAEEEIKRLASGIARLEVLEYQALEYIKADVEAQETAINSLFRVARWKMFDYTLDGGVVETCEVMTEGGASFSSMNDAAKIQCGMDCIRVISQSVGSWATIFIDNAESITQKEFDTEAQVVRLRVQEGAELTVSAE